MYQRGSITVYLSLTLAVIMSLIGTALHSVQSAGARVQAVHGVDQGLYSLFARYDIPMLEKYHLFFLDGSFGQGSLQMGQLYGILEKDTAANLDGGNRIIDNVDLINGSITGYTLATDNGGNAVKSQAVAYMETMMGIQGVRSLAEKVQGQEETVQVIEAKKNEIDEAEAMAQYEALRNQASDQEVPAQSPESGTIVPENFINPVEAVKTAKGKGILSLVLPEGKEISAAVQRKSSMVSGRSLEKGMGVPAYDSSCNAWTSDLIFNEYLLKHFNCFTDELSEGGLQYQLEYIFQGKESDTENLKGVVTRLLLIREASNLLYLYQNEGKRAQAQTMALIIAALFGAPQGAEALETVLMVSWAFGESVLDLRELLDGGKVPLLKDNSSWQISLSDLPRISQGVDALRKKQKDGMTYRDYLRVLLMMKGSEDKAVRCMDMMEMVLRKEQGKGQFRLDCCLYAAEIQFQFEADRGNRYQAVRNYGYDMKQ
ncbi:MAG: DUF5702 domain-containing protein [Ruminococcus sp.]